MRRSGFTLVELLVVLAIIGLLLSIAAPRYSGSTDRAKEAVLRENLATLRDAIDKYYADTGNYPGTLDDLVNKRYLRRIPLDPVADSTTSWVVVAPPAGGKGAVYDVKSGATGKSRDGASFQDF